MIINRNFLLLWQGLISSSFAMYLFNMAAVSWLVEEASSASLVGALYLALGLPIAIVTPLGGVMADRFSRRNIIVCAELSNGITVLVSTALFFGAVPLSIAWLIPCLIVNHIILGMNAGFFQPAFFALLPDIVPKDRLAAGNAIFQVTGSAMQIVGRATGGLIFTAWGAPIAMLITGICFILSGVLECLITEPDRNGPEYVKPVTQSSHVTEKIHVTSSTHQAESKQSSMDTKGVIFDLKQGISLITADRGMTQVLLLSFAFSSFSSVTMVTLPFLVEYHYNQTQAWYGYLLASLFTGFTMGALLAGKLFNVSSQLISRAKVFVAALALLPLSCVGLAFAESVYTALLVLCLMGVFSSIAMLMTTTQFQLTAPNYLRGRIMSVLTMVNAIALPISAFLTGLFIDLANKDAALIQGLFGMVGGLLVYLLLLSKAVREFFTDATKAKDNSTVHQT